MSEWIEWKGGECPVPGDALVEVMFGDGAVCRNTEAKKWNWSLDFVHSLNIVAYRLPFRPSARTLEEAYEDADKPISDNALNEQVGGSHYKQFEIQPIQYINANNLDFLQGNVVKYITRHKLKGKRADVEKAIHCCKLILEMQYGGEE